MTNGALPALNHFQCKFSPDEAPMAKKVIFVRFGIYHVLTYLTFGKFLGNLFIQLTEISNSQ